MIMYLSHLKNKQVICGFILLAVNVLVLILILVVNDPRDKLLHQDNILDGCYHIYIDAGSNIGNSIRKIFEPEKYPDALLLPIYDKYFGTIENRRSKPSKYSGNMVCAVGFEPNPFHTLHLKKLETAYQKCGWNIKMMTRTGISHNKGESRYYQEKYQDEDFNLSGGILSPNLSVSKNKNQSNVITKENKINLVQLSDFLKNVVSERKLPMYNAASPPKLVIKMDIEGSEVGVVPDLIFNGGLRYVNLLMVEWHARYERILTRRKAHSQLREILRSLSIFDENMADTGENYSFRYTDLDDETYQHDNFNLPVC